MERNHILNAFNSVMSKSNSNNFSVFAPIIEVDNELHLLFEVRSLELNHQPGEICFPGGKIEDNESPIQSAIRETIEELNISKENIEIIAELSPITTLFNVVIYPFCGFINNTLLENIKYSTDEVGSIFTVPLRLLLEQDPLVHTLGVQLNISEDFPFELIGNDYKWKTSNYPIYFYQYNNYIIWGLTARIVKELLDIIRK